MKNVSDDFIDLSLSLKEEVENIRLKDQSFLRMEKAEIPKVKMVDSDSVPEFPDDITNIPDTELGKYIGIYESVSGWISYCIARREIDFSHATVLLDFVYNKLLSQNKSSKITDSRVSVESDTFYLECRMDLQEIEADLKMLRATLVTYQNYAKAISREISSRKSYTESFSRSDIIPRDKEIFHGG